MSTSLGQRTIDRSPRTESVKIERNPTTNKIKMQKFTKFMSLKGGKPKLPQAAAPDSAVRDDLEGSTRTTSSATQTANTQTQTSPDPAGQPGKEPIPGSNTQPAEDQQVESPEAGVEPVVEPPAQIPPHQETSTQPKNKELPLNISPSSAGPSTTPGKTLLDAAYDLVQRQH